MQLLVKEKQSKEIKFMDYKALCTSLSFQADDFFSRLSMGANFPIFPIIKYANPWSVCSLQTRCKCRTEGKMQTTLFRLFLTMWIMRTKSPCGQLLIYSLDKSLIQSIYISIASWSTLD